MNLKFVIFWALLAYVSAANLPKHPATGDLREAFETEDSLYIPITDEEAEQLRLPRSSHIPKRKIPNFEINGVSEYLRYQSPEQKSSHYGEEVD